MGTVQKTNEQSLDSLRDKLNEIRKIIDEDKFRHRVLLLCQQTEPKSFEEYSLR